jgi:hypothetical protein
VGFVARWLLAAGALERDLWPVALAVALTGFLPVRAGLDALARHRATLAEGAALTPTLSQREKEKDGPALARAGLLALPLAALCLVPALVAFLVKPALAVADLERPAAAGYLLFAGPSWPALLLALVGPVLGVVLYAGAYLKVPDAVPSMPKRAGAARWRSAVDAGWAGLGRLGSAGARWAERLEGAGYLPVAVAVVVVAVFVLAS